MMAKFERPPLHFREWNRIPSYNPFYAQPNTYSLLLFGVERFRGSVRAAAVSSPSNRHAGKAFPRTAEKTASANAPGGA
jgi:hypothetical protein